MDRLCRLDLAFKIYTYIHIYILYYTSIQYIIFFCGTVSFVLKARSSLLKKADLSGSKQL